MKKNTVIILITSTFLVTALAAFAIIFFAFNGNMGGEKADRQMVLIDKGYFNTKTDDNGAIHIVSTGCKIYYKDKYKKKVTHTLSTCEEDINSVIGAYFREKKLEDIAAEGCFEDTQLYIKDEINALLNERIDSNEALPVEYVTDVILFDTVYQQKHRAAN